MGSGCIRSGAGLGICLLVVLQACVRQGYEEVAPEMELSATRLDFAARVGEVVSPQTVLLTEAHDLEQVWRAESSRSWVTVDPESGAGAAEIRVSVRTRDLQPGTYQAEVVFNPECDLPEAQFALLLVEFDLQAPGWTSLGGPYGGDLRVLVVDPADADRVLAGAGDGWLWLSLDGGENFERLPDGFSLPVSDVVVLSTGRAYLSTRNGDQGAVWRSDDGGESWAPTALSNIGIDWLAAKDQDFLLAAGPGLFRSLDGGQSFETLSPPNGSTFVEPDPARPGGFVVGGSDGTVQLTQDGLDFTVYSTGQDLAVYGLTIGDDGSWYVNHESEGSYIPYEIRVSKDTGQTWSPVTRMGLPDVNYNREVTLRADGDHLWALFRDAFLSEDAGDSFFSVALTYPPQSADSWYSDARVHPGGMLLAHQGEGVLRHLPGQGLRQMAIRAHSINDLAWDPEGRVLYGVTDPGGVFRMDEDGTVAGLGGTGLSSIQLRAISPDPRNPQLLLAGSIKSYTGVYRSEDNGQSWTLSAPGLTGNPTVYRLSRAPENPDVIWAAAGYNGLYFTQDGGTSWTKTDASYTFQVTAVDQDLALAATNGLSRHRISTNQMEQIQDINEPSLLRTTSDGSVWYGDASYPLYRSTDGAETFEPLGLGGHDPTSLEIDPQDPQRIYVGYTDGLFGSPDGGQTWQELGAPFPVTALCADPETGVLFVGTARGGIYRYTP